jgi:hypothetical protein
VTGAAAAVTGAATAFTAEATIFTGAATEVTGAATEVTDATAGTTEPLVTACAVPSSVFPAPATVAVTAGVRAWPTWAVTERTVPSAAAAVSGATEVTVDVTPDTPDVTVPAARTTEPVVAARPDVTAGITDSLVTTCVTACTALPAPATTVTTAEPGAWPPQHAGQPTADGAGRCRLTTGAGTVPGGNPDTVGGFGATGGCPPPAGLGTLPPEVLEALPPRLPVSAGSIGGPVGTGCGWTRWRGWSGLGGMAGAEPIPNKPGRIAGTMTDVTRVNRMMAVTMTALGAAIPAG